MSNYHNHHPSVSFEVSSPTDGAMSPSDTLMNGGPVGPFDGEYINGHSTNGTTSPSTPGFIQDHTHNTHHHHQSPHAHHHHQHHRQNTPPRKKLFSTEELPVTYSPPRADTWPQSPLPESGLLDPNSTKHSSSHISRPSSPVSHPVPPPGPHEGGTGGPRSRTYARARTDALLDDDANASSRYPRISRPVELLRSSYDCVVIGSGYGGAVAASRAARAGEEVCVLELGKERWPGEYPSDVGSALGDLHFSGEVSAGGIFKGVNVDEGDPTGMYHLIFGKGQNAVVCNGELAHHLPPPNGNGLSSL